jgi:hypothetical protein
MLLVSLRAAPRMRIKIALHVFAPQAVGGRGTRHQRATRLVVLYRIGRGGRTDAHGRFSGRLPITYRPRRPVPALLTVITPGRCGAVTYSALVTLAPVRPGGRHQHRPARR